MKYDDVVPIVPGALSVVYECGRVGVPCDSPLVDTGAGIARDETAATKEVAHEAKATRAASQEALQQLESEFCN
eukprot:m.642685 g.642685  ORF g.642685 m.642685 type:complete len:74 (-) comp22641_c0_seq9:385-606(-)